MAPDGAGILPFRGKSEGSTPAAPLHVWLNGPRTSMGARLPLETCLLLTEAGTKVLHGFFIGLVHFLVVLWCSSRISRTCLKQLSQHLIGSTSRAGMVSLYLSLRSLWSRQVWQRRPKASPVISSSNLKKQGCIRMAFLLVPAPGEGSRLAWRASGACDPVLPCWPGCRDRP